VLYPAELRDRPLLINPLDGTFQVHSAIAQTL